MRNLFAVVFGWPLALLALVTVWGALREAGLWPRPPQAAPRTAEMRHRAIDLARQIDALPPEERAAFDAALDRDLVPLPRWLEYRTPTPGEVLCIGEDHRDATRTFLAHELLPALAGDVLMLEESRQDMRKLLERIDAGAERVELLGADIAAPIRAARRARPGVEVLGIDERADQRRARLRGAVSELRDVSIAANFRALHRDGLRHVVLFGALHCSDRPGWLFYRLRRGGESMHAPLVTSIRVIGSTDTEAAGVFAFLAAKLGHPAPALVVEDTRALPAPIYELLPALARDWRAYDTVILFRD